jgi:hypothetical protein
MASYVGVTFTHDGLAPGERLSLTHCVPAHVAGRVVHVTLDDRSLVMLAATVMAPSLSVSPTSVPSGTVTFVATNIGAMRHSLLVWPVPAGANTSELARLVASSPSLAQASSSCGEGPGHGIAPGQSSWVSLSLARGTYALIGNSRGVTSSAMTKIIRVS